ncbi:G-box binding factor [Homalodisca vitripennis]|nr:G-box binding factor [Homalodisca vitripennis]
MSSCWEGVTCVKITLTPQISNESVCSIKAAKDSFMDEENDILIKGFAALKDVLNSVGDLRALDPLHFLDPFLEVIKSEETTGPVTSLALSSISKFLSYGLIEPGGKSVPAAVERIADAVTHARFVGTDQASDGVVLMKILQVLRTLILSPIGIMLTNDSVCEIMLSCLRICFETRLSELLRRCAEHYLKDMVQLLFTRLPYFSEDLRKPINMKNFNLDGHPHNQAPGNMLKIQRIGVNLRISQESPSPESGVFFVLTEKDSLSPHLVLKGPLCLPYLNLCPQSPRLLQKPIRFEGDMLPGIFSEFLRWQDNLTKYALLIPPLLHRVYIRQSG